MNRKTRRAARIKTKGVQDSSESTLQEYWIPMKRKSKAGIEYVYYKKVVDKIGLKK